MKIYFKVFIKISLFNICTLLENPCFSFSLFFIFFLFFFFFRSILKGFAKSIFEMVFVTSRIKSIMSSGDIWKMFYILQRTEYIGRRTIFMLKSTGGFDFVIPFLTYRHSSSISRIANGIRPVRAHTILRYRRFNPLYYPKNGRF